MELVDWIKQEASAVRRLEQTDDNRLASCLDDAAKRITDLEAMASEMISAIPGGSVCDPQQISDALREIAAKHGVQVRYAVAQRLATIEAILRALVQAVDEQDDIDPTVALHRAMADAKSWLQATE